MSGIRFARSLRILGTVVLAASTCIAVSTATANAVAATKRASDETIVKAGLLTLEDLPPGWTETASSSDSTLSMSQYGNACARLQKRADQLKKARTAHGESPDFKKGSNDEIGNSVTTYPTAAQTR